MIVIEDDPLQSQDTAFVCPRCETVFRDGGAAEAHFIREGGLNGGHIPVSCISEGDFWFDPGSHTLMPKRKSVSREIDG